MMFPLIQAHKVSMSFALWLMVTLECTSRQSRRSMRLSSGLYGGRKCVRMTSLCSASQQRIRRERRME
jgi:hypothetical protein